MTWLWPPPAARLDAEHRAHRGLADGADRSLAEPVEGQRQADGVDRLALPRRGRGDRCNENVLARRAWPLVGQPVVDLGLVRAVEGHSVQGQAVGLRHLAEGLEGRLACDLQVALHRAQLGSGAGRPKARIGSCGTRIRPKRLGRVHGCLKRYGEGAGAGPGPTPPHRLVLSPRTHDARDQPQRPPEDRRLRPAGRDEPPDPPLLRGAGAARASEPVGGAVPVLQAVRPAPRAPDPEPAAPGPAPGGESASCSTAATPRRTGQPGSSASTTPSPGRRR